MNNYQLEGFKEELTKEAAGKIEALKKGIKGTVEKVKGVASDAKEGYKSGRSGQSQYPKGTNTQQAAEFVGKHRNKAIAGGAVATAGTGGYVVGKKKEAQLSKEAAGFIQGLKNVAKGKQAREGYANLKSLGEDFNRVGLENVTDAQALAADKALKNTLKGTAKTVGLYGGGAVGVGAGAYGVNRLVTNN